MELLQLIVLSIIQGLTEFLPISSAAHLVLLPLAMDWEDQGLATDVALHLGSLLAVCLYFRKRFMRLILDASPLGPSRKYESPSKKGMRLSHILVSSFPILLAGFFFRENVSTALRVPTVIAIASIGFALPLWLADVLGRRMRGMSSITVWDALAIGGAQVFALIPGVSRSGITITMGLFLGLDRYAATCFSFFMAVPVILAAAAYECVHLINSSANIDWLDFGVVVLFSMLFAWLSVHFFIKIVDRVGMLPFVLYRLVLGTVILWFVWG